MTPEELEEAVARRLVEVIASIEGIAGLADYEDACERARAREVIRCMEWARRSFEVHRCPHDCPGCHDCETIPPQPPLTLPDPDWRPE